MTGRDWLQLPTAPRPDAGFRDALWRLAEAGARLTPDDGRQLRRVLGQETAAAIIEAVKAKGEEHHDGQLFNLAFRLRAVFWPFESQRASHRSKPVADARLLDEVERQFAEAEERGESISQREALRRLGYESDDQLRRAEIALARRRKEIERLELELDRAFRDDDDPPT